MVLLKVLYAVGGFLLIINLPKLVIKFFKLVLSAPPPRWLDALEPIVSQFDDPTQVSSEWLQRQATDKKAREKDAFETTTDYRKRLATLEAESRKYPHSLICSFLVPLDYSDWGRSYHADSQIATLRTKPFEFNLDKQKYNRLFLDSNVVAKGSYTLQNYFGVKVDGTNVHTTTYLFEITNFRALAAMRKKRIRKHEQYDQMTSAEQIEGRFPLKREYARSEFSHLQLSIQVRVENVSYYDGYTYGGDKLEVPDTHHKSWVTLRGNILAVNVVNMRTKLYLGGWQVRSTS